MEPQQGFSECLHYPPCKQTIRIIKCASTGLGSHRFRVCPDASRQPDHRALLRPGLLATLNVRFGWNGGNQDLCRRSEPSPCRRGFTKDVRDRHAGIAIKCPRRSAQVSSHRTVVSCTDCTGTTCSCLVDCCGGHATVATVPTLKFRSSNVYTQTHAARLWASQHSSLLRSCQSLRLGTGTYSTRDLSVPAKVFTSIVRASTSSRGLQRAIRPQIMKLGAKEVKDGAIIVRLGEKLYLVDADPSAKSYYTGWAGDAFGRGPGAPVE